MGGGGDRSGGPAQGFVHAGNLHKHVNCVNQGDTEMDGGIYEGRSPSWHFYLAPLESVLSDLRTTTMLLGLPKKKTNAARGAYTAYRVLYAKVTSSGDNNK